MKKVVWIGPIVRPDDVYLYKAQSAAANIWQLGFINGLLKNNLQVIVASYIPFPAWPRGPSWVDSYKGKLDENVKIISTGYVNIMFFRELFIGISLFFKLILSRDCISEELNTVFTYNPILRHRLIPFLLKNFWKKKIKWLSVLADGYVKGNSDKTIFLSHDYYTSFKGPKSFIDGGISESKFSFIKPDYQRKILVYAGSQSKLTGIKDFIDLFLKINQKDFELHIFGYPSDPEINKICSITDKVKQFGFVTDEVLISACENAFAFVSPRSTNDFANTTFPSKLLYYLQFEKPIVSTKTKTLHPKFDHLLFNYDPLNEESLVNCLIKLSNMDLEIHALKVKDFKEQNSWQSLVENIVKNDIG